MTCPSCGFANPSGVKFCGNCARALGRVCPTCGVENPPEFKFCGECAKPLTTPTPPERAESIRAPRSYTPKHLAEKILTSRAALEGERKQVTVLFADVKGSMELAEQLDPEEWHRLMDRFFAILAEGVHRFEGTVNQFTGDGIMALFGAPIAHEDHAQRACYAALHLRQELRRYANELRLSRGVNFSVRMGLNSGEVVVGRIGDDLRMDYTAQGHTVGLAARMEQIAEAGHIYLTEHTAKLAEGYVALRDLGQLNVKGVREPIRVHDLEGVGRLRTRLEVSRARGFSRFVGRDDEMRTLEAALARAREGNGQVVGVLGEAGVGKSRLCFEFLERCRAQGLTVIEGHAVAHGKNIPFLPILQIFRGYFGIGEQDSDRAAREKIAGKLVLLDEAFGEELPLMFEFMGVADPERPAPRMDPEARQRRLFGMLRRGMQAGGQQGPGVTLIEDLHWLDGGSEAWLEQWVDAMAGARSVLLLNFRPEYRADWMHKSCYRQIPLLPLGPEAITELLDDLLGTDAPLIPLKDLIRERTGGNPFFIEEVVQSLLDEGVLVRDGGPVRLSRPVTSIQIPATLQAVLAARIDRLAEREKQILQTAAVIGKTFPESILKAVVEETHTPRVPEGDLAAALRSLKAAEFLYEQALYPEAEYAFKHPLTQEVAYSSQLTERRARVHAAVARAIQQIRAGKLDEQAAVLAYHWEAAGEALEAARWHRRAAEWAGMGDLREALRHWQKVRALLDTVPESAETHELGVRARACILSVYGWRFGLSPEEAKELFDEGWALASRAGDARLLAEIMSSYGLVRGWAGELEEATQRCQEVTSLADKADDPGLRVAARMNLATSHWYAGRLPEALKVIEEGIELSRANPTAGASFTGRAPLASLVMFRAGSLIEMGRFEEGERALEQAAKTARSLDDADTLRWISVWHSHLAIYRGDARAALDHSARSIELGTDLFYRMLAYFYLGLAQLLNERWHDAAEALERSLAMQREARSSVVHEGWILAYLSRALLALGEHDRAHATAEEAVAAVERYGTRLYAIDAHLALARVLTRTEGAAAASRIEGLLEKATGLIRETGARSREPFIHEERAELARVIGDEAGCQREVREAHRPFTEMGATGHVERLARELGL